MPLPSSNPTPQVSGLSGPGYANLPAYTLDPAKLDQSFATGFNTANAVSDNLVLRPRQVQAAMAQADLTKVKAQSDMSMVPLEAAGRTSEINSGMDVNSVVSQQAKDALWDRMNPGQSVLSRRLASGATSTGFDKEQADQAVLDAHKTMDTLTSGIQASGGTPTPEVQDQLNKSQKALDSAIGAQAKAAAAATEANTQFQIFTAQNLAAKNKALAGVSDSQVQLAVAAKTQSDKIAQARAEANTAAIAAAQTNRIAANPVIQAAAVNASVAGARTAENTAAIGGAAVGVPLNPATAAASTPVLPVLAAAAGTQSVTGALYSQSQYYQLVQQLASGNGISMLTPKAQEELRAEAIKMGVNVVNQPIQKIAQDLVAKVNVKEAEPVITKIREESDKAQAQITTYQGLDKLIKTGVPTGFIYGVSGNVGFDKLLAEFGNKNAELRRQFNAIQNSMIPDATRGLGRMTAPDIALFKQALPGESNTPATNAVLVSAALVNNEVLALRGEFYNALVGKLKVGDVDTLWKQYRDTNPLFDARTSTGTAVNVNKNFVSPDTYLKLLDGSSSEARDVGVSMQKKVNVSSLPTGNSPEELAAIPSTVPFYSQGTGHSARAVANPAYWAPIAAARNLVQNGSSFSNSKPLVPGPTPAQLLRTDFNAVPLNPAGEPAYGPPPSVDILAPWKG